MGTIVVTQLNWWMLQVQGVLENTTLTDKQPCTLEIQIRMGPLYLSVFIRIDGIDCPCMFL